MKFFLFLLLFPVSVFAQRSVDLSSMQLPGTSIVSFSGSYSAFSTTSGNASASQGSVTISGSNLSGSVLLTAPIDFEVSFDNSTFTPTVSVSSSGGIIPSQPKTVYCRIKSTASIGTPAGNIVVTSVAATVNIPVSGTVTSGSTTHWRALSIPNTSVSGGSDLTNFTAEITINGSYLATLANGGKVQNASGFDIEFAADNAGATLYNWEIESWNPVSGLLTAWVKIPTLSSSTTTTVYLLYGNSSISTFQGGATGTAWDANTIAAYHFGETLTAAGQTVKDWGANSHPMTSAGTWSGAQTVTGVSGNALKLLNANSDRLTFTSISLNSTYTIEGWYQATSGLVDGDTYSWANTSTFDVVAFGDPAGFFGLFAGSGTKIQDPSGASGNTWYHMVFTRTGTTWIMYRNGAQVLTNSTAVNIAFNNIGTIFGGFTNDEIIDEHRLYSVVRTAGWIATEYNNQNVNATWFSIGAEN